FFAIDMLAGGNGGQGHLLVQRIRGGDVDHVDLGVRDHAAPVGGGMGKAEIGGGTGGGVLGDVGDRMQFQLVRQVEDLLRAGETEDMGLAHEAGAGQADTQDGFVRQGQYPV